MKNTNRSIMSVVLALAMVFTSVSGFSKSASQNVKAGTPDVDITGVTVESNIVENGDTQLIDSLSQKTIKIDGVTYNNYSRYTGVSASASTEIKKGGTYKDITDGECNIKVRGNTTAGATKKPWNIKLSGKKSVLGMDKGKKWCLLANSFDKSLMRNSLVYDLGLQNGVTYSSQSRFVDVYINGTYL